MPGPTQRLVASRTLEVLLCAPLRVQSALSKVLAKLLELNSQLAVDPASNVRGSAHAAAHSATLR
eukprot:3499181-Pleurochrysis_carterae.AAC.1